MKREWLVQGLNLNSEPETLSAHVTLEGSKIVVDRSEFPIEQYPALTNAKLMQDVARLFEQNPGWGERAGS